MEKQKRTLYVSTAYETLKIVNLKNVWVNSVLGTWQLIYKDDIYDYNCIYWNNNNPDLLITYQNRLIEAYNRGDTIIKLL